jgi:hypothetical protein
MMDVMNGSSGADVRWHQTAQREEMKLTLIVNLCQVDSIVLSSDIAELRSSKLMDVLVDREVL